MGGKQIGRARRFVSVVAAQQKRRVGNSGGRRTARPTNALFAIRLHWERHEMGKIKTRSWSSAGWGGVEGKGFSDGATQLIWKPAGAGLK
jgi:hypothetical protein